MQAEFSAWWGRAKPVESFTVGGWSAEVREAHPEDVESTFGRFVCMVGHADKIKAMVRLRPGKTPQLLGTIVGLEGKGRKLEQAVCPADPQSLKELVILELTAEAVK